MDDPDLSQSANFQASSKIPPKLDIQDLQTLVGKAIEILEIDGDSKLISVIDDGSGIEKRSTDGVRFEQVDNINVATQSKTVKARRVSKEDVESSRQANGGQKPRNLREILEVIRSNLETIGGNRQILKPVSLMNRKDANVSKAIDPSGDRVTNRPSKRGSPEAKAAAAAARRRDAEKAVSGTDKFSAIDKSHSDSDEEEGEKEEGKEADHVVEGQSNDSSEEDESDANASEETEDSSDRRQSKESSSNASTPATSNRNTEVSSTRAKNKKNKKIDKAERGMKVDEREDDEVEESPKELEAGVDGFFGERKTFSSPDDPGKRVKRSGRFRKANGAFVKKPQHTSTKPIGIISKVKTMKRRRDEEAGRKKRARGKLRLVPFENSKKLVGISVRGEAVSLRKDRRGRFHDVRTGAFVSIQNSESDEAAGGDVDMAGT